MIRVTVVVELDETWGADECFADLGERGVIDLVQEDQIAFLEHAKWTVEQVTTPAREEER